MRYYSVYIDKTNDFYTYASDDENIKVGDRVLVSFRNKERVGLILKEELEKEFSFKVLKIKRVLYEEISFSKKFVDLLLWIKEYYLSSFDQVFSTAVPSGVKIKYEDIYRVVKVDSLFSLNEVFDYFLSKIKVRKKTLVDRFGKDNFSLFIESGYLKNIDGWYCLDENSNCNEEELKNYFELRKEIGKQTLEKKFDKKILDRMVKNGELIFERRIKSFDDEKLKKTYEMKELIEDTKLNLEQQMIKDSIEESDKKHFLIRGVTGSGKTEIYIHLIKRALEKGNGSIFLVPEISLTPQMVLRFKKEFGERVAILHSRLTQNDRAKEWYSIYTGEKQVVLGVRSAIFAPVKNLEYIVIDEEHENSYKQDSNPRYNAKYVGIKRAELENAKVILGSATPSIESYYYAQKGIFQLYEIENRYKDAKLPEIDIVDMKKEEDNFFSEKLLLEMRNALLKKEQIILLLNRKGYSTLIQCEECGYMEECEHCSIKLNYYSSNGSLKCNYCGISKRFTGHCSKCGSDKLSFSGRGVERVEEELRKKFPVNIIRVDGEVAKEKDFYENMYNDFLAGKYDIMIGTQMISRGLHFPNVTVVGVINADTIMSIPDFRSGERTYQMITQVAGRAGRGDKDGKVIIQTYQPENYIIEKIQENSYKNFYEKEIEKREILFYPPFSKVINIGISSEKEAGLEEYCYQVLKAIQDGKIEIYGPMKSLVYKVKGRYRCNIFIKGDRKSINDYKKNLEEKIKKVESKNYRIVVDVDPINLI
ncbi:primosomal protein N' [Cetobacterium sp. 8H]|uniref:replication restart helicase PriA n=1 Tax=Cetobacterium sp. 8H TaxID=2759681 RepID=UPI00163BDC9F|nr:primosomal protein N' [Cetobacterium sp. 8H]MBC2851435.1 primosomal protein N' [Cetobacterium sp. 8H]